MLSRPLFRIGILAMLTSILAFAPAGYAQEQSDPETRGQLAAIPLPQDDLPSGYALRGESFIRASGDLESVGFIGMYLSVYEEADGDGVIRSYASMWTDAEAAANGFELLEGGEEGMEQQELDAGDGPAEVSTDGTVRDATFVVDQFVVGVSIEGGSVDEEGLSSLVESLESRANTVASGEAPSGVDLELPGLVLDTQTLGSEVRAGFLSGAESEQFYGLSGSSLGGMNASWVSLVAAGESATAPFVTVSVTSFDDADNAGRVVEQADELVPLTITLEPVDGVDVPGADTSRAFQYTSASGDGTDSFRVVMQLGSQLAVVDVQGAGGAEAAQQAATALAGAQAECMGGTCEVPAITLDG